MVILALEPTVKILGIRDGSGVWISIFGTPLGKPSPFRQMISRKDFTGTTTTREFTQNY